MVWKGGIEGVNGRARGRDPEGVSRRGIRIGQIVSKTEMDDRQDRLLKLACQLMRADTEDR